MGLGRHPGVYAFGTGSLSLNGRRINGLTGVTSLIPQAVSGGSAPKALPRRMLPPNANPAPNIAPHLRNNLLLIFFNIATSPFAFTSISRVASCLVLHAMTGTYGTKAGILSSATSGPAGRLLTPPTLVDDGAMAWPEDRRIGRPLLHDRWHFMQVRLNRHTPSYGGAPWSE